MFSLDLCLILQINNDNASQRRHSFPLADPTITNYNNNKYLHCKLLNQIDYHSILFQNSRKTKLYQGFLAKCLLKKTIMSYSTRLFRPISEPSAVTPTAFHDKLAEQFPQKEMEIQDYLYRICFGSSQSCCRLTSFADQGPNIISSSFLLHY